MKAKRTKKTLEKCSLASDSVRPDYSFRPLVPKTKGFFYDWENCEIVTISYPKNGQKRVRKVSTRSSARITWRYPGYKSGRMHEAESLSEYLAFQILDADPSICRFREQPVKIVYRVDGELRTHYPDILIERSSKKELWEIKSDLDEEPTDVFRRTELLKVLLAEKGFRYRLISGVDLKQSAELHNSKLLLKFGRYSINVIALESARLLLESNGVRQSDFLIYKDIVKDKSLLYSLVLKGIVTFDQSQRIEPKTLFSWQS